MSDSAHTPSSAAVDALVKLGRVDRLVPLARAGGSPSMRRWLVHSLERALSMADPGAVSAAQRDEAVALGVPPDAAAVADVEPPPHAVSIPFAALDGGPGTVRMVHVALRGSLDDALWLSRQSRDAVQRALELAAQVARPGSEIDRYTLVAAQPAGAAMLRVEGESLGAAAYVSAVARWTRRRVRPGTVITGTLTATGIGAVGFVAEKLEAALGGRADVRRIIVPSANAAAAPPRLGTVEVIKVATHAALLDAALEPHEQELRPDDAVQDARRTFERGWQGWRWPAQREPLERLAGELPAGRPDLRVAVLTMWAAVARHLGTPDASLEVLDEAERIAESDEGREAVPDLQLTELHQHRALTLRQLCRFAEASDAADRAVEIARRGRLRGELLEAHGCAGIVALSRGRADDAVAHQRKALELVHAHRPISCPRTHGYLVEALGSAGDVDGAREEYHTALDHLAKLARRDMDAREAWLRTSFACALSGRGRPAEVLEVLDVPEVARAIARDPQPGLVARRCLGLARAAVADPEGGWALLADSPAAYGRLMPHVRFAAHLNVLFEARSRLALGALSDDARARARSALGHVPGYGLAGRWLGEAARQVTGALDGGDETPLRDALDRLLDRASRVA